MGALVEETDSGSRSQDTIPGHVQGDETLDGCDTHTHSTRTLGRARAWFAAGEVIGRYVVLSKLGAGGMGVVYAAYDPELDRKVALKMLLAGRESGPASDDGRARLLREAQALAKFSHPEIVAIYDVGEHSAGVWLAMEFVDGGTLGAWAEQSPRSWTQILEVMRAAGRGVAAAHAAGLVHRDLKPDNIMVGRDGRVRVMDFGLTRSDTVRFDADEGSSEDLREEPREDPNQAPARPNHDLLVTPLTRQGSLLGTPAYMSPEQFSGEPVTAAADQFAFCVTFWELLYGERPFAGRSLMELAKAVLGGELRAPGKNRRRVPSWLRRGVERGLAREPSQRWPSMQALLDELGRGRARVRNRRVGLAFVGVATVGAAAFGWQQLDRRQHVLACERRGEAIQASWNDETRARVRASIRATKVVHAETTLAKLMPWLDAQAVALQTSLTRACMNAEVDATWSPDTRARADWCLGDRQLEFESLVDRLERADARVAEAAIEAAAGLEPVETCVDEAVLASLPEPPRERSREASIAIKASLAEVNAGLVAGDYPTSLERAREVRAEAEAVDWLPLVAAAHQLEGRVLVESGAYEEGERISQRAYVEAATASAWAVAEAAASNLAYNVGSLQARPQEGRTWLDHAQVATHFAGDPIGLREANQHLVRGTLFEVEASWAEAQIEHERALAIWERVLSPDHPTLALGLTNLGNVRMRLGATAEGMALHERALAIRERAYGPEHPDLAASYANLGNGLFDSNDFEGAIEYYQRALKIWEPGLGANHPIVGMLYDSIGNAHANRLEFAEAKSWHERAERVFAESLPADHPFVAQNLGNLAIAEFGLDPASALPTLERALLVYEASEGLAPGEAAARFLLARTLELTHGDLDRARREAEIARDGFLEAGPSKAEQLAEVEAWLAERAAAPLIEP